MNTFKILWKHIIALTIIMGGLFLNVAAQTTISTVITTFLNNAGSGTVLFNFQNTNAYPIVITDVSGIVGSSGANTAYLYYNTTPVSAAPTNIDAANGWSLAAQGTFTGVGNSAQTNTTLQPFLSNISFVIPANTTYGIAVFATGQRYYNSVASNVAFSGGGCNILMGPSISYAGSAAPPSGTTSAAKGWLGSIGFKPVPQVANNAKIWKLIAPLVYCAGSNDIKVMVENTGTNVINNMQVGWSLDGVNQTMVSIPGPVGVYGTPAGDTLTVTLANAFNIPAGVHNIKAWPYMPNGVPDANNSDDTLNAVTYSRLAGTYTVNPSLAASVSNFQTFDSLSKYLNSYGVCGPVVVSVAAGSAPFTEKVTLGDIPGASASNTIKINGNGNTLQYNSTNTAGDKVVMVLDGTKYLHIDNLIFKPLSATVGRSINLTGGCRYDSITNCIMDHSLVSAIIADNNAGITFSASTTTATTSGDNGKFCFIGNNQFKNPVGTGGMFYGVALPLGSDSNVIANNLFENYYSYGVWLSGVTGNNISNNEFTKATKISSLFNFYAIYSTGTHNGTKLIGNKIHAPLASTASTTGTVFQPIYITGGGSATNPMLVANNIIYNINQATDLQPIFISAGSYIDIYHNTITLDKAISGTGVAYGIYAVGTNNGLNINNNLINITAASGGVKYGMFFSTAASMNLANLQKNNIYVNSIQAGLQYYLSYNSTTYATLAAFQAANATSQVGAPNVNPQFTSAATGNLFPTNAALFGSGMNTAGLVPTDIVNVSRSITPTPGAYEMMSIITNDAGVVSITSPTGTVCMGNNNLSVKVVNGGIGTLNNVVINWSINGVLQTPVTYSTAIPNVSNAPNNTAIVSLGNVNFTIAAQTFKIWTSAPNGATDGFNLNDTLQQTFTTSLGGTYTLNPALAAGGNNFQTFTSLAATLASNGVCGPVIVNVAPGTTYTEAVTFTNIPGASAVNTIKINGNGATLQFTNTSAVRQLMVWNNVSYLKLDSLNFKTLDIAYGWGLNMMNQCTYDSLTRCTFDLTSITSISSMASNGISFSSTLTNPVSNTSMNGSNCYIGYNKILGTTGAGGPFYGIAVAGPNSNNVIDHNFISNYYNFGLFVEAGTYTTVSNNELSRSTKTDVSSSQTIVLKGICSGSKVVNNKIHDLSVPNLVTTALFYGIYCLDASGTATDRILVANNEMYNMSLGGNNYGLYCTNPSFVDLIHNSVNFDFPVATTGAEIAGIYVTGTNNNATVQNNNVYVNCNTTVGIRYGLYYGTTASVLVSQKNNIYVNPGQIGVKYYGRIGTQSFSSMELMQVAYPTIETGSFSVNPLFVSPSTGNLTPGNYVLLGSGVNMNAIVPSDINGLARVNPPVPGAFEIVPVGTNNAASVDIVSPKGKFCPGLQPLKVSIGNAGSNDLNSVQINWTLNGVLQTPIQHNTVLHAIGSGTPFMDTVTLANLNFSATVATDVKCWTSKPNNMNDLVAGNDTINASLIATNFVADAVKDTVCSGTGTSVTLLPSTVVSGGSVWQGSANGTTWFDLPGVSLSTISTGLLYTDTFYRFKINNSIVCYSNPVNIKVSTPAIISSPDIIHCGEGTVNMTATLSNNAVAKWYDSPTAITPLFVGSPFVTPNLTANTTYYLAADIGSTPSTCATSKVAIQAIINPKPVVNLGQDLNICAGPGDVFTIDAGTQPNNGTYLWDNLSTNQTRDITQPGTYFVDVTNSYNCTTRDSIIYVFRPKPVVDLGPDTNICKFVSITLDAGPGAVQYFWNTGQFTQTINVTNAGAYDVEVTSSLGCIGRDTIVISQQGFLPSVDGIVTTNNANYTFQFTAINPQNITEYDWDFGDGTTSNEPQPIHAYPDNGNYIVVLHVSSICGTSVDSAEAHIVGIHQINISQDELTVFPNPAQSQVTILNKGDLKMEQVYIYNVLGQVVYHKPTSSSKEHVLDLKTLNSGVYTIQIYTDKGTVVRKLDVQR